LGAANGEKLGLNKRNEVREIGYQVPVSRLRNISYQQLRTWPHFDCYLSHPQSLTLSTNLYTGMRRITMFWSTKNRIYDGDPISYNIIIPFRYYCLQYSVEQNAVQVCSLETISYNVLSRFVVGYTVLSRFVHVRTTTKSPNDAFLRTYPRLQETRISMNIKKFSVTFTVYC